MSTHLTDQKLKKIIQEETDKLLKEFSGVGGAGSTIEKAIQIALRSGTAQGARAGAQFGPWGVIAGAIVGSFASHMLRPEAPPQLMELPIDPSIGKGTPIQEILELHNDIRKLKDQLEPAVRERIWPPIEEKLNELMKQTVGQLAPEVAVEILTDIRTDLEAANDDKEPERNYEDCAEAYKEVFDKLVDLEAKNTVMRLIKEFLEEQSTIDLYRSITQIDLGTLEDPNPPSCWGWMGKMLKDLLFKSINEVTDVDILKGPEHQPANDGPWDAEHIQKQVDDEIDALYEERTAIVEECWPADSPELWIDDDSVMDYDLKSAYRRHVCRILVWFEDQIKTHKNRIWDAGRAERCSKILLKTIRIWIRSFCERDPTAVKKIDTWKLRQEGSGGPAGLNELKVGPANLNVEFASTPEEIQQGLMHRDHLDQNSGMLFAFSKPTQQSFWMKNTKMPLSIAFLDEGGSIFDIKDMNPFDETPIRSSGPAKYALEVNKGWFDKNNVTIGDKCAVNEAMTKAKLIQVITEEIINVTVGKDLNEEEGLPFDAGSGGGGLENSAKSGTAKIIQSMFGQRDPVYEKTFKRDEIYENGHNLRESTKHIDLFERTAATTGVPIALIIATAWKETKFRNNDVSTKDAKGMMQLMQVTRKDMWRRIQGKYEYDESINKWVTGCTDYIERKGKNGAFVVTGKRRGGKKCLADMEHYKALNTREHLGQLRNGNFNGTIDVETAVLASTLYLSYLYKIHKNWSKVLCDYSASGGDSCSYGNKILYVAKKGGFQ